MKKKLLSIIVLIGAVSFAANAQLTTGNPTAKEIRTGNRPQAGDFGLYTGLSSEGLIQLISGYATPLPIVNIKYYATDKLEARIGIDVAAGRNWEKGLFTGETAKSASTYGESWGYIEPGIAYHFSKHNIIDVYAGAEIPLGYHTEVNRTISGSADTKTIAAETQFNIGLRPFIGLQAFIGDLPLAIGLEYGWRGYATLGEKIKTTTVTGGSKQVSYEALGSGTTYDKLSAGSTLLGNEIRLTLSYYFK